MLPLMHAGAECQDVGAARGWRRGGPGQGAQEGPREGPRQPEGDGPADGFRNLLKLGGEALGHSEAPWL